MSSPRPFPLNLWLCFLLQSLLLVGVLAYSTLLSRSLDVPYEDKAEASKQHANEPLDGDSVEGVELVQMSSQ